MMEIKKKVSTFVKSQYMSTPVTGENIVHIMTKSDI